MALKGNDALTNAEIYALDRLTKKQYEYLDKFEREVIQNPPREIADLDSVVVLVEPAPMTPGQFVARLERYGNAVWQANQQVNTATVRTAGIFNQERRVLGMAEHCGDCPPLAAMGWQPLGSLPMIGDTECNGHCKCHFEYRVPGGQPHVAIPKLPSGPGPAEKKKKKIILKPPPKIGEPYPKGGEYPPAKPLPSVEELLKEAGSPYAASEYEEA